MVTARAGLIECVSYTISMPATAGEACGGAPRDRAAGGYHQAVRRRRDRDGRERRRRTWGQRLAIAGGCLSTIGLLAAAAGLTYLFRKYERLPRIELSGVLDEPAESDEPENYLIVGIDNAANLPRGGRGARGASPRCGRTRS